MQFEKDKESLCSPCSNNNISKANEFNSEIFKINSINSDSSDFFYLNYNILNGEVLNGARKLDKFNFISDVGGVNEGSVIFNVNVPYTCLYFLEIKYINYEENLKFKVTTNNIKTDLIYSPEIFSKLNPLEILTCTLPIALIEGDNTIKFHGNGINKAPYLGNFSLKLPPIVNNLEKGILEGSAYIEPNMNFVGAIGGSSGGAVTASVKVSAKGMYNLKIQYVSGDKMRPLKIDINDLNNGDEYVLPLTEGWSVSQVKIFSVLINLNTGINTIRFHGDGINYGPNLGAFMIDFAGPISTSIFASATKTYNITSGTVGNGAIIDKKLNMVTNIGGSKDGFVTITVPIDTYGKYLMKINYTNNDRPLKIDINEIDTGTVYMVKGNKSDIFAVTIPLVLGINTLRFHGDSKNTSPDLGNLTLELIKNDFNSDFNGNLLNGATILPTGVITGLGGKTDGQYIMDYIAEQSGKYIVYITADTSNGNVLLINIDGESTGFNYNMPKDIKVIVYTIIISLKQGANTIILHGDYKNNGPNILKIEINLAHVIKETIYELSNGILENGANLDEDTGLIDGIGGVNNGSVTIKINVDTEGMYDLIIKYIENEVDVPFKIDINNNTLVGVLPCSDLEEYSYFQKIKIIAPLNKGSNNFKIYGNEVDKVSKLAHIIVRKSNIKTLVIYRWDNIDIPQSQVNYTKRFLKAIWNDEEYAILINGAFFSTSNGVYIASIGGSNKGAAIIEINIPKSGDYTLTLNYLTIEANKKLLIDFNYANNPQKITFSKTNGLEKKDIKTIEVKASLVGGKNTIIFSGDGVNTAPLIGDFTIYEIKNTQTYRIVSQELKRGAKEIQKGKFITALGGKNKGHILLNITVSLKGQYDLGFMYTSPQIKRSLKIKINKKVDNIYFLPITSWVESSFGKSFTIPLNLIAGSNVVEISGDGNVSTPNIGQFNLAVSSINSIIIYDTASGVLKNGARVNNKGMVCNIGGPKQGEISLKITVPFSGVYNFDIEYETFMGGQFLEILINDISILKRDAFIEIIDSTLDLTTLNFNIKLDAGNSIIKFKGTKQSYAPNLGKLKISVDIAHTKVLQEGYFDIAAGVLQNGAGIEYETGLVVNLGGKLNGSVTVTTDNSIVNGAYLINIEYRAKNAPAPILIDINGEEDGNIYILSETGDELKRKSFIISLKNGKNIIKFYGDKNDDAPDLNIFSLTPLF